MPPPSDDALPFETLGPFRLVRQLGEGGTSVVFLAERIDFAQRVTIKLFHDGIVLDNTHEENILSGLNHPHIVRIIDTTAIANNRRYFVMEYVDGIPIDIYCDTHRLTLPARIALLLQILDAVEHTHRRLIVHGDLKPANILVTAEGNSKLLDFGATAGAHTPDFASPEQRTGDRITLATDIYSLGLIARLLLAGIGPSAPATEFASAPLVRLPQAQKIAEDRSTTVPKLVASLHGDLDAILRKALSLNPDDRYLSADQFAVDLRNTLNGRPISARRSNRIERTRKWVLRHKLLAALSALLAAVIIFSAAGVLWQSAKAAHQRRVAQSRLHDLVRLTGALDGELYDSLTTVAQSNSARASLIAAATQTLNNLADTNSKDPILALELAGQYEKLARLRLAQTPPANNEAAQDIARGIALLRSMPTTAASQTQLNALITLQQSIH